MTELNAEADPATGADQGTPEARAGWPSFQGGAAASDAAVEVLLERLGALPSTPVSQHGDIYGNLHDDLMDALNEDVTGQPNATGDAAR
ncbi:hypothetical protein [Pseudarthrobacter sp. H2]|uniref:hypothetical protein n=1 Tax=Pseudarthrobacter sp. H2 TaxID=3418415 RepID=UPI003CF32CEB